MVHGRMYLICRDGSISGRNVPIDDSSGTRELINLFDVVGRDRTGTFS